MIEDKLRELSIELPTPPSPAGSYIPVVTTGNLAFVSGQIPMKEGKVIFEGKVPETQSLDSAREAAKICIINTEISNAVKNNINLKTMASFTYEYCCYESIILIEFKPLGRIFTSRKIQQIIRIY